MIRKLVAAVVAVIVTLLTIQVVEVLGHLVYPPPADIEFGDPDQVREFMSSLPVGSILFVGAAWAFGKLLGTLDGALVSISNPLPYAIVVGGLVLAGSVTMLLIIPHPWWFTVAAPLSIIAAAILGIYLAPGLRPSADTEE